MSDKLLDFNGLSKYTTKILEKFNGFVPTSRKVNDKPLTGDIKLTYSDVGAQPSGSYVPTSRRINNKTLTDDITLTASDISGIPDASGFVPTSRTINKKDLTNDISLNAMDIEIWNEARGSIRIAETDVESHAYFNSISLGYNSRAITNGIAIGRNSNGASEYSIAIGIDSNGGSHAVSIGRNSSASKPNSISIGTNTIAASNSVAIGLGANINSSSGIAIGPNANISISAVTSANSIAIGKGAKINGSDAISIGHNSRAYANYSMAIGYYSWISEPNTIQLGDANISSFKCAVQLDTSSDERDKTDIIPIDDGAVEFLKNIKAIRYHRNPRISYIQEEQYDADDNLIEGTQLSEEDKINLQNFGLCSYDKEAHARGDKKGERVRVGILAQEVRQALKEVYGDESYGNLVNDNFYDRDPSTIPEGVENQLSITYSNFIPFLIKAIQEQQETIEKLQNENVSLIFRVEQLERKF